MGGFMLKIVTGKRFDILRCVAQSPHSNGATIAKSAKISHGGVYTTLHRLEADGLVESWTEDLGLRGPPRRFYKVTKKGSTVLRASEHAVAFEATGTFCGDSHCTQRHQELCDKIALLERRLALVETKLEWP